MKKIFSIIAALCFVSSAFAVVTTPYKNLYAQVEVAPSGAGEVYIEAKNDEDNGYVFDISEDYDQIVYMMATLGENGTEAESLGCNTDQGVYEAKVYAEAAEGYELVCLSNAIVENGVYGPSNCYAVLSSESADGRTYSFDYTDASNGVLININSKNHPQDGSSAEDDVNRDGCFSSGAWSETPDTYVYAIYRKIGETKPYFDKNLVVEVDKSTDVSSWANAVYFEKATSVDGVATLNIMIKAEQEVTAVEFELDFSDDIATAGTAVLDGSLSHDFFGNNNKKVVAFSTENATLNNGALCTFPLNIKEGVEAKRYEVKVKNVVFATTEGEAIKVNDEVMQYVVVTEGQQGGLKGDANNDGKVAMSDANLVVNAYTTGDNSAIASLENADVTGEGDITMADANGIVNIFVSE